MGVTVGVTVAVTVGVTVGVTIESGLLQRRDGRNGSLRGLWGLHGQTVQAARGTHRAERGAGEVGEDERHDHRVEGSGGQALELAGWVVWVWHHHLVRAHRYDLRPARDRFTYSYTASPVAL